MSLSVNSHWDNMVHSEWRVSDFSTLSCTGLGEGVGGMEEFLLVEFQNETEL